MIFERMVSRLRAAHALSFAMTARTKPRRSDLEKAGLRGVNVKLFDGKELHRFDAWRS